MPHKTKTCPGCGGTMMFESSLCMKCVKGRYEPQAVPEEVLPIEGRRVCRVCLGWTQEANGVHKKCDGMPDWSPPAAEASREAAKMAVPAPPPFSQAVLDLETYCLDRTWGVTLMATVLVHGEGRGLYTYSHRDTEAWRTGKRGDDSEIFFKLYKTLEPCAIWYGHNIRWFDDRWFKALCLKYGVTPLKRKLIDPVQISKNNFALANNRLGTLLEFIDAKERKMDLEQRVWRDAFMDDDDESWRLLRERNISDVIALNELATKVAPYVGLVDFAGSAWR